MLPVALRLTLNTKKKDLHILKIYKENTQKTRFFRFRFFFQFVNFFFANTYFFVLLTKRDKKKREQKKSNIEFNCKELNACKMFIYFVNKI